MGLDARKVICEIPAVGNRIRKLISIATPHFGSPVADAVLDSTHALHKSIPAWLMSAPRTVQVWVRRFLV